MNKQTPRKRAAISILNRLNQGHDLAIVLGMDIELALYQIDATLKVNSLIQPLREEFKFKSSGQNILNGKALLNHLSESRITEYPFGMNELPPANQKQKQAISIQISEIIARMDTAREILLSESLEYKKDLANFVGFVDEIQFIKNTEPADPLQ
ncbi:MAG: hypothetical protein OEY87_00985 [Gammaproteobacteria bacterium]|nr:hypothetical protein [Gammaproteobacteria bacterium]MDH5734670.1 hypothetical protein [Gammaproteobacteria bacterium]